MLIKRKDRREHFGMSINVKGWRGFYLGFWHNTYENNGSFCLRPIYWIWDSFGYDGINGWFIKMVHKVLVPVSRGRWQVGNWFNIICDDHDGWRIYKING